MRLISGQLVHSGYAALRDDGRIGRDILRGTTTTLQNAPMAVAYMGPEPEAPFKGWNANVMIEIGYRLASRLPLIFFCDQTAEGDLPKFPVNLAGLDVIPLPTSTDANWVDRHAQETIDVLVRQFQAQEQEGQVLDSMHPIAIVTAGSAQDTAPNNLYYTATSDVADDMFGVDLGDGRAPRLRGLTMDQFLSVLQKRMHPAQWRAFNRHRREARNTRRATGKDRHLPVAVVPLVFEYHENDEYNRRAFLPIIVQDYRPLDQGLDWYSLRILYLNVTTATQKAKDEDGEEYYVCQLDPTSDARLEPLKAALDPIRVFLSSRSGNRANVEAIYNRLRAMSPYVEPFMDTNSRGIIG